MKFALATKNKGKIREICDIMHRLGFKVVTCEELGIDIEVEETGTTFSENAFLKATAICEASKLPSIADDSGICIDALDGAPGVYSSSFGGEGLSDSERCEFMLTAMKNMKQRGAKFVTHIVCVFPNGNSLEAVGECRGTILNEAVGTSGFGYDPIFQAEGYNKSMAELSAAEKNQISHRGKALRNFADLLRSYC